MICLRSSQARPDLMEEELQGQSGVSRNLLTNPEDTLSASNRVPCTTHRCQLLPNYEVPSSRYIRLGIQWYASRDWHALHTFCRLQFVLDFQSAYLIILCLVFQRTMRIRMPNSRKSSSKVENFPILPALASLPEHLIP